MLDFAVITGVVVGVTQLVKPLFPETRKQWIPLTSVLLAVLFTVGYGYSQGVPLVQSLVEGLIAGLTANGLYDQVAAHA